jgi:hypothetical protein
MKKSSVVSGYDAFHSSYVGNSSHYYSTFGDNNIEGNSKNSLGAINNLSHHTCISNVSNTVVMIQKHENILPLSFE